MAIVVLAQAAPNSSRLGDIGLTNVAQDVIIKRVGPGHRTVGPSSQPARNTGNDLGAAFIMTASKCILVISFVVSNFLIVQHFIIFVSKQLNFLQQLLGVSNT
jgi:hypothetical protein